MSGRQLPVIVALGTAQTLAWASSVYLPAILADPIAHDLGISANLIFGANSGAVSHGHPPNSSAKSKKESRSSTAASGSAICWRWQAW